MFELLFTRPSTIARYRCAPLLNERLHYLAHCEQTGIGLATLRSIATHQLNLVGVLDLRDDDGLNARRIAAGVRQWSSREAPVTTLDASTILQPRGAMAAISGLA